MAQSVVIVGWDVGPWKCSGESKDAVVLLEWDGHRLSAVDSTFHGNIFDKMAKEPHLDSLLGVVRHRRLNNGMKVFIAIDAVFGWPRRFGELVDRKTDYLPDTGKDDKNTGNCFLYRETERFLINALKLKSPNLPKTAVGDAVGSAATKAQFILSCLRKKASIYVPPLDAWDLSRAKGAKVTIIEAYPGVTKFSAGFENMDLPRGIKMKLLGKTDPEDALRCAMVAACYANMVGAISLDLPALYVPTDATQESGYDVKAIPSEGWIFSPK